MATTRRELMDGPRSTFQVGTALGKTFSIWIANLIPFAIISLVVFSPLYFWAFLRGQGTPRPGAGPSAWDYGMPFVLSLLQQVATGAMTFGVVQQLNGSKADLGTCISKGFARLIPVLLVAITAGLGIMAGALCLLVPGIILSCMWAVAVPVAIIENPGVMASLGRSSDLTRGSRIPIFLVILVLWVLGFAVNFVIHRTFGGAPGELSGPGVWVELAVSTLVQGTLSAVAGAVIYNELRVSREGASIADIAKVFD